MARFTYLGEPERASVVAYGPTTVIRYRKKDGTIVSLSPVAPATEFAVGQDIGYDIDDDRAVRMLSADSRFALIP